MIRVKICGLTRAEDAHAAEDAGADAIGMIFVPGTKRFVEVAQAKRVVAVLGPLIARVGVFRNAPLPTVLETIRTVGLSAVQLNGQESPEFAAAVAELVPVVRVIGLETSSNLPNDGTLMIDGPDPGSGQMADQEQLRHLTQKLHGRRWLLAGGLTPENVALVVQRFSPWGVDVSSGVELEGQPGRKDHGKIRAFVHSARGATA